jgi:glycosyltransferase involved in cell wall biosynthesis
MPHVVFVNRVYPPAGGATGAMLAEMAGALVEDGWRVTVLTGPAENAPSSETTDSGVHVERVGAARFTRDSIWRRAWAYISLYPAFLARALQLPSPDVIVTKTDPPMLKMLGPILGAATGARTVHWAQDLYPEIAEALDVIGKNGVLAGTMRRLSTWALKRHDRIAAVGRCMKERITDRGIDPEKISVIPNWPPSSVSPTPHADNPFRADHALDGRFVVMYSGNLGLAHPFDGILGAAERLQKTDPEVLFLFVGDGPRKDELESAAGRRGLDNVRFLPFQPFDRLAESLSAADVHLVTMRPSAEGLVVPSKLYGALQAGRPALFLGPSGSEAARVLRENDCGTVLEPDAAADLAAAVRHWKENPDRRQGAGRRARTAVADQQARSAAAFQELLASLHPPQPEAPCRT